MRKCVFGYIGTARTPISMCLHSVYDESLCCPLTESFDTIECINAEQRPGWAFVHGQDDLNVHFLA